MSKLARVARKFVLANKIQGKPKVTDFKIVEESLPATQDGQILTKADYLTVDPYMRAYAGGMKVGDQMIGYQVATVIESRNPQYPEGSQVVGNFGWRDLTSYKPGSRINPEKIYPLPEMKNLPASYALGCMGMPGNTAYFGLLKLCDPKPGEILCVTSAGGAVGSLVAQIGKIKGCKVLAFAGAEDKLRWLKEDLKIEHTFNYKTIDVMSTLKENGPINCYFDNVGGEFSFHVTRNMAQFGRIALCGAISVYNKEGKGPPLVPIDYFSMIYKNIRQEGFVVTRWNDQWFEGIEQIRDWIVEGKIKVHETVSEKFESMPSAFIDLLEGKNVGKMIIKAH